MKGLVVNLPVKGSNTWVFWISVTVGYSQEALNLAFINIAAWSQQVLSFKPKKESQTSYLDLPLNN